MNIRPFLLLPLVSLAVLLAGCSTNPVTGKQELSLVSEQWELKTGAQQYLPMRQSQGGDYVADPEIQAYVNQVGQRLAAVSDRKLPYEFHVLNSSIPNAWALPGGKISINRGLLIELNSEAELAAVLGHEIVHAAAKHGAQGMQRGLLLQGAVLGTVIVSQGENYANLAQMGAGVGAQLVNTKYGRDAERESDLYGIRYMVRAGYDPQGAVDLQKTFVKMAEGKRQDWIRGLFSSHPASRERLDNNARQIASLPKGGEMGRERYQQKMARLNRTVSAYQYYGQAQKALSKKEAKQAKTLINKAIKLESKEGHFRSFLGDIEYSEKHYSRAKRQYNKAIGLNDQFFYYHLRRGLTNEQLNRPEQAREDLKRSNELLPTAGAMNALGNLAREAGDMAEAKKYYRAVVQQKGEVGKQAYASLVDIDLPQNPNQYLSIRHLTDNRGRWIVEVNNPTPRPLTDVILQLEYPTSYGQSRKGTHRIKGGLAPGQSKKLNTGVVVDTKQIKRYNSKIIAAKVSAAH